MRFSFYLKAPITYITYSLLRRFSHKTPPKIRQWLKDIKEPEKKEKRRRRKVVSNIKNSGADYADYADKFPLQYRVKYQYV